MDYSNKHITAEVLKQISYEVALINSDYNFNCPIDLKDGIFELLDKVGTLILYPFPGENLWGIYICKNEKHYFIINSLINLERKIFAAAHELAHSLDIAKVKFEVITAELMTEYVDHKIYGDELGKVDAIANRFAAELLVGKRQLKEKFLELPESYDLVVKAVLLSDFFLVPYKTIVRRFIETELIDDPKIIDSLLDVDSDTIKSIAERYECCRRNQEISKETRLGGYVNKALTLYENDLSTYDELKAKLALLNKEPEDYDIIDEYFDVNEFLRRASENPEVEDQDGVED